MNTSTACVRGWGDAEDEEKRIDEDGDKRKRADAVGLGVKGSGGARVEGLYAMRSRGGGLPGRAAVQRDALRVYHTKPSR